MTNQVSHVKNPLTIIAVFAGLAEVSGTVVLPLLELETQRIYVWFLMGFPNLLLILFFITLWAKHYVLYAPSDFRDDKGFADLIPGSGVVRAQKLEEETVLATTELSSDDVTITPTISTAELTAATVTSATGTGCASPIAAKVTNSVTPDFVIDSALDKIKISRDARANVLLAEELVLAKLSKDLQIQFNRNVTATSKPDVMFDAVAQTPDRFLVVEIKFTRQGMLPRDVLNRQFERVQSLYSSLSTQNKRNFLFILAKVTENQDHHRLNGIQTAIEHIALKYEFKTQVLVNNLSDLEKELADRLSTDR